MIKPSQPPLRAKGKQANRAYGAREMHPYSRFAGLLHGKASHTILSRPRAPYESCSLATPEGEILATLCFELLMNNCFSAVYSAP